MSSSWATAPARTKLNVLRYLRHSPGYSGHIKFILICIPVILLCHWQGWWIAELVITAMTLLAIYFIWDGLHAAKLKFFHGNLVPAMIISTDPLQYISVADMAMAEEGVEKPPVFAVRLVHFDKPLPGLKNIEGEQFACVATYMAEEAVDKEGNEIVPTQWANFAPEPLCLGTGNKKLLASKVAEIGENEFHRLNLHYMAGRYPDQDSPTGILFLK